MTNKTDDKLLQGKEQGVPNEGTAKNQGTPENPNTSGANPISQKTAAEIAGAMIQDVKNELHDRLIEDVYSSDEMIINGFEINSKKLDILYLVQHYLSSLKDGPTKNLIKAANKLVDEHVLSIDHAHLGSGGCWSHYFLVVDGEKEFVLSVDHGEDPVNSIHHVDGGIIYVLENQQAFEDLYNQGTHVRLILRDFFTDDRGTEEIILWKE